MISFAKPYDSTKQTLHPCCDCNKQLMVENNFWERLQKIATKKNQQLLFCCHDCHDAVLVAEKNARDVPTPEKQMNLTYTITKCDVVDGCEDNNEYIYRRDEKGDVVQETVHCFRTEPQLMIEITELGACPLGRYPEAYRIRVRCGEAKLWNDFNFIGTLEQAKTLGETKLIMFARQQQEQLQNFLKND